MMSMLPDDLGCICVLLTHNNCWMHYLVCRLLVLGCSDLEKKVDILTKMTDEVTKRQQEREDTAQQYKRYLVECIDMTM